MKKMEQFPAKNPNPVISVGNDGTILYSNGAGEPLLHEWGVGVGEKLPSFIGDFVQRVIFRNSPEKMEIKVGKRVYSVAFHPLPEEECVNIYGFDISDQKELEGKLLGSEAREMANLELADIIDTQVIQSLMDDFYKLAHITMALVDLKGNVLVGVGWQDICTRFHRVHPEACKHCMKSDTKLSSGVSPGEFKLYKCKNNMWDIATPIIVGGQHVGNALSGQFFFEGEPVDYELFRSQAKKYGFNEEEYIAALEKVPRLSRKTVNTGMSFLMTFANMVSQLGYSNIKLAKTPAERDTLVDALRENEEKYRNIIETASEGILIVDTEFRATYINKKMEEMLGYSQEEMIGKSEQDFTDEIGKVISRLKRKNILQGINESVEFRLMCKDGSSIWTLVNAKSLFDKNDKFIGSLAMVTDITERKKAEEALEKARESLEVKVKERTAELEKAYDLLKESEKGLAEAQRMAHIGNWNWNIAIDKKYWSDEVYRIFGLKPQEFEVTYDTFLSYVHPDDRDYVDNATKEAFKGKPYSIDFRIILADGEEHIVHEQGEVVFDEKNIPIQMKGTIQNITEFQKAEEKIRNLANIVESSNDAIITISLDGIITSWNKGAEQVYGYSAEKILGKPIFILEPGTLAEETKKLAELIKQGEKFRQYETLRLRKDGTIINVSITLSPVFDIYRKLTAISVIYRDITKRKEAEEKLRESEEKYRNIVETANEGIYIIDDDGIVTYVNKKMTDVLGYNQEEGVGRSIWDFVSEEDKNIVKQKLEKRKQGINESYELKLIRKDGSFLWALVNAKSLFDKDGKFMGVMSMLTDITERKKAEKVMKNLEISRKQEIHHRIKNNLQVISSLLDLQVDKFDNPKVIEAFRESQNRVRSMALIHEELYKGEGTDTLNFSIYIQELSENLFKTYRYSAKNIHLSMDLEKNAFFNMDTAVPLGIIVNELITNSLKHAFQGRDEGEIRIKLHREEHKKEGNENTIFTITVSDNGVGIPENFEIEDLDSLGIQLITTLVDQLDGELELKRNNGTEFSIRFTVTEEI